MPLSLRTAPLAATLAVVLAIFPSPVPAQSGPSGNQPTGRPHTQEISGWIARDDIDGRYHIEFPATPAPADTIWDTVDGKLVARNLLVQRGGLTFLSAYADYPTEGDAGQRLDGEVRMLRGAGFALEPAQSQTISGKPARRFSGVMTATGTMVEGLYVIDGRRLYKVMVNARAGQDNPDERRHFLSSFLPLSPPLPVPGATSRVTGGAAPPGPSEAAGGTWIADSRTGCRVWNADPQDGESIRWSGACTNGLAQGPGVLEWLKDGRPNDRYEGEYRAGKMNGRGKYTFNDGDVYDGEYRDNEQTGRATMSYANGDRYEGDFVEGDRSGRGVMIYANGARYEGAFVDDKRQGRGVMVFTDGSRYEGEFHDNKLTGRGIYSYKNGNRYEGTFVDGKRDGNGAFAWANGDRYVGAFSNNEITGRGLWTGANGGRIEGEFRNGLNGRGVWTGISGDRYEGSFVDGKFDGRGVYVYAAGNRYEGQFRSGQMDGHGIMVMTSGDRFEGEFHGNKPNGPGVYRLSDGRSYSGVWRNGCFRDGANWIATMVTPESCGFK